MSATVSIKFAESKLRKAGFVITWSGGGMRSQFDGEIMPPSLMLARRGRRVIECIRNGRGDTFATIRTRSASDHDDMQSDYSAGSFFDSLKKAIDYAVRP